VIIGRNATKLPTNLADRHRHRSTAALADLVAERGYLDRHPQCRWEELRPRRLPRRRNRVKSWLNSSTVSLMSAQQFAERDPAGEIRQRLTAIGEMVAGAS
jgi:hypothetical protein